MSSSALLQLYACQQSVASMQQEMHELREEVRTLRQELDRRLGEEEDSERSEDNLTRCLARLQTCEKTHSANSPSLQYEDDDDELARLKRAQQLNSLSQAAGRLSRQVEGMRFQQQANRRLQ